MEQLHCPGLPKDLSGHGHSAGFLVFITAFMIHPYRLICNASLIPLSGEGQDKNTGGLCTLISETQQR